MHVKSFVKIADLPIQPPTPPNLQLLNKASTPIEFSLEKVVSSESPLRKEMMVGTRRHKGDDEQDTSAYLPYIDDDGMSPVKGGLSLHRQRQCIHRYS